MKWDSKRASSSNTIISKKKINQDKSDISTDSKKEIAISNFVVKDNS